MAEILLSLTIIGVVAAITLPSLTGNINERTWNTQRKALYARMSQAISLMPSLNGYGTLVEGDSSKSAVDTAAETFVTDGLSKVLKINNICDSEHLADCGIVSKINTLNASQIDFPKDIRSLNSDMASYINTTVVAFETANGESVAVYYNPRCIGSLKEIPRGAGALRIAKHICVNFVYDLNGNKGPNTVGKDIGFMSGLYPFDATLVAPFPAIRPLAGTYYAVSDIASGAKACTSYDNEYRLPNIDELISLILNFSLITNENVVNSLNLPLMSSSRIDAAYWWGMWNYLAIDDFLEKRQLNVWCVKR